MINSFNDLLTFLGPLLTRSPVWIVWLIGVIIAIRHWHRCPRSSALTLISITMLFFMSLVTTVVYRLLPRFVDPAQFGVAYMVVGLVASFVHAIAWACLLVAIFSGRGQRASNATAFDTRGHAQKPMPYEENGNPFQSPPE